MSFNDYGFELLSDQAFSKDDFLDNNFLTTNYLNDDLERVSIYRRCLDVAFGTLLLFLG